MWEYFKSIPRYWIKRFGIDGFRCDIAYRVPPKFWKACIAEARQEAQSLRNNLSGDVVFLAEAYTTDLKELQEAGFSAVYGDYSNKLARRIDLKGYLDYMYNISGNFFPRGSRWFIFPEAHDFGRTPQKVLGDQAGQSATALLANQSRWLLTATLPGTPLIFNGFEKIEWQPINLFSYGAVDWESDLDLRNFISKVNRIRHWYKALQFGSYTYLPTNQGLNDNTQLFAFMRQHQHERLLIVVNLDVHRPAGPAQVLLPEAFDRAYTLTDLLTDQTYSRSTRQLLVKLEPGQAHLFKADF
jgi:glycosidase